jgi:hypothetical protein
MPLADTALRNAKPGLKPQKLFDGGGLFLLLNPNGGIVKLTRRRRAYPSITRFHYCSAGTRHRIPDAERSRSENTMVDSSEQVPADTKEVLHDAMY